MQYRKRPVVIEAHIHTGQPGSLDAIVRWVNESGGYACRAIGGKIEIHTLEGRVIADVGDWVIKGVRGEFYPCKPDIFAMTYEPVESSSKAGQT